MLAKDFIWTTFKGDFLNIEILFFYLLHPQITDFQIVVSRPKNHTSLESLFIHLSDYVYISIEIVLQGHK